MIQLGPPGFPPPSSFSPPPPAASFVSDFSNVFGQQEGSGVTPGAALFGDVLQPAGGSITQQQGKMLTGDLDSSLANLASNLDFGSGGKKSLLQSSVARGPPMTQGGPFNPFPGQQQQQAMAHPFM